MRIKNSSTGVSGNEVVCLRTFIGRNVQRLDVNSVTNSVIACSGIPPNAYVMVADLFTSCVMANLCEIYTFKCESHTDSNHQSILYLSLVVLPCQYTMFHYSFYGIALN